MRRELKPCGTNAAAERHRRRGEPLDEACRRARNARARRQYDGNNPAAVLEKLQGVAQRSAARELLHRHRAEFVMIYRQHLAAELRKRHTPEEG